MCYCLGVRRASLLFAFGATALAGGSKHDAPAKLEDTCLDGSNANCKRHALDTFHEALAKQRAGKADRPLRISYFGDSLTADDQITHALRKQLQQLVGDGGPGFVFAAAPHPYCQHRAVSRVSNGSWKVHGVSTIYPPDHLLGLGGSAESDGGGTIRFTPTGPVHTVDVHYLAQPHGGKLDVAADGKVIETIATTAEHKQAAFSSATVPDGTKKIELRAHGRVRLFGASFEAASGAVVDNLGVVNATAKAMHNNNLDEHLRNQLAHRASDLVVVMYGTNEAEWLHARGAGMAEHEKLFGELLATVRAGSPDSSCLVVSPLDQLDWRDENMPPRDSIPAMVAAQRRAAEANGCAFWDVYTWMGGKGASRTWHNRGFMSKDYQHPTSEGAERIAAALYAGLVAEK
ncbi:MAG: uncharacterized protein JWO36_2068 [Myxococcales bacterium]|nr:uncharacterized protein [Myxococcales bacterium]